MLAKQTLRIYWTLAGAVEMSKAALYFANAAKKVTMQPVVNEVLNERARIRQLQTEIDGLRNQLVRLCGRLPVSELLRHCITICAFLPWTKDPDM